MLRVCLLALMAAVLVTTGGTSQEKKKKKPPMKREATPPEALATLPGFRIELLHTADPATEGSWICLGKDNKGRLIIGGQRGHPTLRVTLKDGKVASTSKLALPISEVMGLLYAHGSLYVNGAGPKGFGLYRCRDTRGTDTYDEVQFLKRFEGSGEHGPHGLDLGPDGKVYVMNGNHTRVPEGMAPSSPHRNYREDFLLPRQWDGNGHATGVMAPGGYVVRTDAEGKHWELVLAGFRNAYDLAFNADGELFTFDSDMEWDWGMPWYRPTRVNHCTSASEFGWRSGSGKWPDYYLDSLGAVVDIGIGSPTGVLFGTGARFPAKYQRALYVLDWTFGRLIAVHLEARGSTYTGTFENFVSPAGLAGKGGRRPLPLTDAVIGDDGAMYFTIGGRNTQAALYRVSYTGSDSTAPAARNPDGARAREQRRDLERFHGKADPKAVEAAWPHLGSDDRALRYAARVAIEHQPVAQWQAKALAEKGDLASLTALAALARCGPAKVQPDLLASLERLPYEKLPLARKLDWLRVLQLTFIRQGSAPGAGTKRLLARLEAAFPDASETVNRELFQLLVHLQSPRAAGLALQKMRTAVTQEDQIHYLFHGRTLPIGLWTMEQRREYFGYYVKGARKKLPHPPELPRWFADVGRTYTDGNSYNNNLRNSFREAALNLSEAERKELAPLLASIDKASVPTWDVKPRPLVKQWKMTDLEPLLARGGSRNLARGKEAYRAGQCIRCHRFGQDGGTVGPDLTTIAARFNKREVLESILEPSKVLSEQYHNEIITTKGGKTVVGRVVDVTADRIAIQPEPLAPDRVWVRKADIESRTPSKVSPMPANLVDVLTAEEILDLLAYLETAPRGR